MRFLWSLKIFSLSMIGSHGDPNLYKMVRALHSNFVIIKKGFVFGVRILEFKMGSILSVKNWAILRFL